MKRVGASYPLHHENVGVLDMKQNIAVPAAVVLAIAGGAPMVVAQQQQAEQLETVIVTATKRSQALEEIPIAISTIGEEELAQRGITEFADYLPAIAGVQFNDGGNLFQKSITIRGVGDGSGSALTQTPVAVYLDETPLTLSQGALNLDYSMIGVDRVTVIKGPHSTLYGAASLGGTVKVETRKPSLNESRVSARAILSSVEGGDTGYTVAGAVAGAPVEGKLGMEFAAYLIERPGYIDDPSRNADDINNQTTTGGRLAVRYSPNDKLTVDGTLYYQKTELNSLSYWGPQFGDITSRRLLFDQPSNDEVTLGSLVLRYDFGSSELVSASSYYDREADVGQDYSSSFFNLGIPRAVVTTDITAPAKVFTQELRLISTGESRWNWLVGAFYSREDYSELFSFNHSIVGALFDGTNAYVYETIAGFGEVSFAVSDKLTVTAGGRFTDYSADTQLDVTGLFAASPPLDRKDSETDFSPRVALNYEYGAGSVYAQAAKGFRVGQANVPIVSLPGEVVPDFFKSDSLWNFEVGAKTTLLDRRLQVNAAAYFIDWSDLQATLLSGTGFTYISNAGSAEIKGLELETVALLGNGFTWTTALSFNDGELSEAVPTVAPKGTRLPGIPDFTFNTSLQKDFTLGDRPGFARVDYLHYGDYDNAFPTALGGAAKNGDYDKVDLRVGMTFGTLEVAVFGNNLLDERPIIYRQTFVGSEEVSTIQPRTFGVSVSYGF
ncbi:MAG: TonB-dependent receptor [Nevskiaceae bacterium]